MKSTQTVFISDLHLSKHYSHLNRLFDTFIQTILEEKITDAVYILGDFFDIWFGDDLAGDWELHIAESLTRLTSAGIPVYFMRGNRDFLMGESFLKRANITLLPDPTVIPLYGKKLILKHGDDLCTEDRQYQFFRKIVRSTFIKRSYLLLPAICRKRIAKWIRQNSQNRGMRDIYAKVSTPLVEQLLVDNQADILIHGHTHCPQIQKQHIILSDWNERGNQLVFSSNGEFRLEYFHTF